MILSIIGAAMLYSWIHTVVINFTKLKNLTSYEKVVLWTAFISFFLFVIGNVR
jgi:hypothetical protein